MNSEQEVRLIWPDDPEAELAQATENFDEWDRARQPADPEVVAKLEKLIAAKKAAAGNAPPPLLAFEIRLLENGRNWIRTANDLRGVQAELRAGHETISLRQQRAGEIVAKLTGGRYLGSWHWRKPYDSGSRGWEGSAARDGYLVHGERHRLNDRHESATGNLGITEMIGHGPYESRPPTGSNGYKPTSVEIDDAVDLDALCRFFSETRNRKLRALAKEQVASHMILRNPTRSVQDIARRILSALNPGKPAEGKVSGSFRRKVGVVRDRLRSAGFVDTPG